MLYNDYGGHGDCSSMSQLLMRMSLLPVFVFLSLLWGSLEAAEKECSRSIRILKAVGRKFDAGVSGLGRSGIWAIKTSVRPIRWSFGSKKRAIISSSIMLLTTSSFIPLIPTQEGQTAAYTYVYQKIRDRTYRSSSNEEQMNAFEKMKKENRLPENFESFPQGVDLFETGAKP